MQNQISIELLEQMPIAMAYVPKQKGPFLFENLEEGYHKGTVFPELEKPFVGKRGRK